MQLTADCAIAAALAWQIGYVACFLLMTASFALTFRQGLVAILIMAGLVFGVSTGPLSNAEASPGWALCVSLAALFFFALVRIVTRKETSNPGSADGEVLDDERTTGFEDS
ncbi:hypothetical protein GC197_07205 [bacterium]|nr:hypothetical protein [bacterium]